ncbi:MAG TPA: myxococcus cysteine-rich repeat containing protein [Candidatus Binatia bacterium]|nr:myxococcus cysteine-rich repeat containing protein [Candidatus Binatia bacterium]
MQSPISSSRSSRRAIRLALWLLLSGWAPPARAHIQPIPLALWGGSFFTAQNVRCSRAIGYVAARCALVTWAARNDCLAAQLRGATCDVDATESRIDDAHNLVPGAIDAYCTTDDYNTLGFGPNINAYADADIFCRQTETAAASAVYLPAMQGDAIGTVDATTRRCVEATAAVTTAVLRFAFDSRRETLNRIAMYPMGYDAKVALLTQSGSRVARARSGFLQRLTSQCSATEFAAAYHRSAGAVLTNISSRADCLAGATTVQNAVVCPDPVCGNGMIEVQEECDDGNRVSGDGCSSDCMAETSAAAGGAHEQE